LPHKGAPSSSVRIAWTSSRKSAAASSSSITVRSWPMTAWPRSARAGPPRWKMVFAEVTRQEDVRTTAESYCERRPNLVTVDVPAHPLFPRQPVRTQLLDEEGIVALRRVLITSGHGHCVGRHVPTAPPP
jgi:hypothetical protein